jgi:malate permease and related proteins
MRNVQAVLTSVLPSFTLIAFAWLYSRRLRPSLHDALRLGMHLFVPCLAFTSILESKIEGGAVVAAAIATVIQIGTGLVLGWCVLLAVGWRGQRELLLPVSFVNAGYLAFPLVLAAYGQDGLSLGVVCYTVMNLLVFTVGVLILHGGGRTGAALREPTLWAVILAGILRAARVHLPEVCLEPMRMAAKAALPLMLVLFGDSLARARLTALRGAILTTALRYGSGALAAFVTWWVLHPKGLLWHVLLFYALLPPAVTNVVLTRKAGRDEEAVASAVLLATIVSLVLLPLLLAAGR